MIEGGGACTRKVRCGWIWSLSRRCVHMIQFGHSMDYEFWQTNTETQRLWYRSNESLGRRPRSAWAHNVSRTAASSALAFAQQNFVWGTEFLEVIDV